jgi:hypothetical protein
MTARRPGEPHPPLTLGRGVPRAVSGCPVDPLYRADVIIAAAVVGCALLAGLAVFQAMLIAGRPWGHLAWGGQHVVLPTRLRVGSAVSIVTYAAMAVLMLAAAGAVTVLPAGFVEVAMWVLAGYFALGIAMNAASRSRPERMVMTPVVLVLAAACLVLALQP